MQQRTTVLGVLSTLLQSARLHRNDNMDRQRWQQKAPLDYGNDKYMHGTITV